MDTCYPDSRKCYGGTDLGDCDNARTCLHAWHQAALLWDQRQTEWCYACGGSGYAPDGVHCWPCGGLGSITRHGAPPRPSPSPDCGPIAGMCERVMYKPSAALARLLRFSDDLMLPMCDIESEPMCNTDAPPLTLRAALDNDAAQLRAALAILKRECARADEDGDDERPWEMLPREMDALCAVVFDGLRAHKAELRAAVLAHPKSEARALVLACVEAAGALEALWIYADAYPREKMERLRAALGFDGPKKGLAAWCQP